MANGLLLAAAYLAVVDPESQLLILPKIEALVVVGTNIFMRFSRAVMGLLVDGGSLTPRSDASLLTASFIILLILSLAS